MKAICIIRPELPSPCVFPQICGYKRKNTHAGKPHCSHVRGGMISWIGRHYSLEAGRFRAPLRPWIPRALTRGRASARAPAASLGWKSKARCQALDLKERHVGVKRDTGPFRDRSFMKTTNDPGKTAACIIYIYYTLWLNMMGTEPLDVCQIYSLENYSLQVNMDPTQETFIWAPFFGLRPIWQGVTKRSSNRSPIPN